MATYNKLSIGSSGEEVRKLQNALMSAGYDVGSSGADGKFGPSTSAAVKKYQKDMGLSVDGVAGKTRRGRCMGTAAIPPGKYGAQQHRHGAADNAHHHVQNPDAYL